MSGFDGRHPDEVAADKFLAAGWLPPTEPTAERRTRIFPKAPETVEPTAEHAGDTDDATVLEWSPYDDMSIAEIVHDYVVVRGDLSEQYARDQLVSIIEKRIARRLRAVLGDPAGTLAEHDAKVRAETLREATQDFTGRGLVHRGVVIDWLNRRADRLAVDAGGPT